MMRKTFLIFWLLSLLPIVLMGSVFYLYTRPSTPPPSINPQTILWIIAIASAILLALATWFSAALLYKPVREISQKARAIAHTGEDATRSTNEVTELAESIERLSHTWQELQNQLHTQTASYQDRLLTLKQFAAASGAQTLNAVDSGAASSYRNLTAQALEIAIKHLGYNYAALFAASAAAGGSGEQPGQPDFVLEQAQGVGGAPVSAPGTETPQFPEGEIEILHKAYSTRQMQILAHSPRADQLQIIEVAIPLTTPSQTANRAGGIEEQILYARYNALQIPSAQPTAFNPTIPLIELQILAMLLASGQAVSSAASRNIQNKQAAAGAAEAELALAEPGLSTATIQRRLAEFETLWRISQAVAAETDLLTLYRLIQEQLTQIMGEVSSFAIVMYMQATDQLHIPYMVEEGKMLSVAPFPLGQGLSSIVIRSRQPLLLAYSSAEKARTLGALFVGEPAKSWLGVPLIVGEEIFGLIIVQDIHQEGRFSDEDQRLLSLVAAQIAIVIRNAHLLEETRRQAHTQRKLNEITDKIRRSVEIETILKTTADELLQAINTEALRVEKASIRLFPAADLEAGEAKQSSDDVPSSTMSQTAAADRYSGGK